MKMSKFGFDNLAHVHLFSGREYSNIQPDGIENHQANALCFNKEERWISLSSETLYQCGGVPLLQVYLGGCPPGNSSPERKYRMKRYLFPLLILSLFLMMGYGQWAIGEIEAHTYTRIDQETAKEMMKREDGHVVVDVRRQDEYDAGHIPGAILIPNESIGCDSPEALPDYHQIILVYCRSGNRSKQAAEKLASMGYANIYEFGGIIDWTGEIVTTEEESKMDTVVLRFSSFSGGGYEYSVKVEDPSIISCETRYEFEENAENIDGASYDYFVSFKGLKPGTTTVWIYGHSPIMESENSAYTVTVDETLRVALTPCRALSMLYVYRNGEISYDSYKITLEADGYHVSVNEEQELPLPTDVADALLDVIDRYDVASWDGFSESQRFVLDGEGFYLDFVLTDGTKVHARGDNVFPQHYYDVMNAMWNILEGITEEKTGMKLYIGGTEVPVTWERNASVEALKALLPLSIPMSMYGGFEQVGSIGKSIVRDDEQTITCSGDIALYSGNQIVIFYDSNSWSYTMLGHVNLTRQEMTDLLSHGDVTIRLTED